MVLLTKHLTVFLVAVLGRFSVSTRSPSPFLFPFHVQGVASRDIKLQNVLVVSEVEGRPIVKLADFGLSSSCAQDAQLWMPGMPQSLSSGGNTVGTPGYMAPEVVGSAGRGEERRAYDAKVRAAVAEGKSFG